MELCAVVLSLPPRTMKNFVLIAFLLCFERGNILSSFYRQHTTTGLFFQRSSKRTRVMVFPNRLERCVLLESKLAGFLLLICILRIYLKQCGSSYFFSRSMFVSI